MSLTEKMKKYAELCKLKESHENAPIVPLATVRIIYSDLQSTVQALKTKDELLAEMAGALEWYAKSHTLDERKGGAVAFIDVSPRAKEALAKYELYVDGRISEEGL